MGLSPEQIAKAQEYNTKVEGQRWRRADLPSPLDALEVGSPEFAERVAAIQVEETLFQDGKLGPRTYQAIVERRIQEEVFAEATGPADLGFWVQGTPWPEAAKIRDVTPPLAGESLDRYLSRMGARHFSAHELTRVAKWRRNVEPVREDWPNIIGAVRLAEILRHELGGPPLLVMSAYHPRRHHDAIGGNPNVQHVFFRALSLTLDTDDAEDEALQRRLYEVAARLFATYGADLKMGLGLPTPKKGTRISIDTGFAQRSWNSDYVVRVLKELGLPVPA